MTGGTQLAIITFCVWRFYGIYAVFPGQSHLQFHCAQRLVALPKQFFAADKRG